MTGGRAAMLADAGRTRHRTRSIASWRPKPLPTSTSARCPGCRARSTRRSRAGWRRSPRSARRRTDADAAEARAHARPPGGRRDPDGRARRRRRLHRRDRAAARAARGAAAPPTCEPPCDVVDRACRKLRIFLDELVERRAAGAAQALPRIRGDAARARRRGVRADRPVLSRPVARARRARGAREPMPPARLPSHLVKQRRALPARPARVAARRRRAARATMREAVAGIEDATTQPNLRAFWWTVGALLRRARSQRGLERGFGVKQLAARIDLQIRRVVEGSAQGRRPAAPRGALLRRDQRAGGAAVQAVQRAFRLAGLIPSAEALERRPRAPAAAAARGARAARRRQGRVAQVHARAAPRTCRKLQADARVGARARPPRSATAR